MTDELWNRWKMLTRFHRSAQIAFRREESIWAELQIKEPEDIQISTQVGKKGTYGVRINEHLAAVRDLSTLNALIIVHSYAMTEAAAAEALGCAEVTGGIENWGTRLLDAAGKTWSDVRDGKPGAVEVAVFRNTISHGGRFNHRSVSRLQDTSAPPRNVGDEIVVDEHLVLLCRGRLQSLLNVGGLQTDPGAYIAP